MAADCFAGSGAPASASAFDGAAAGLGIETASLWALAMNETAAFGFLADRRPKILFERRLFHEFTHGAFDRAAPGLSADAPGGYAGGAGEYARLTRAIGLDRAAALAATSWGIGQLLGANHAEAGFADAEGFVRAMVAGEEGQLAALAAYLRARGPLLAALRAKDWARVAFYFNGPGYRANRYDALLARHYAAPRPDFALRRTQAALAYLGFYRAPVDGIAGPATDAALAACRAAHGEAAPAALAGIAELAPAAA